MKDLQKIEDDVSWVINEFKKGTNLEYAPNRIEVLRKLEGARSALAELEKPAEPVSDDDVIPCVVSNCDYFDIQCLANCCRGEREPVYYLCVNYLKNSKMIKDYAASYHAKKCAECARVPPKCLLCGDPIIVGVCENCAPEIIKNA